MNAPTWSTARQAGLSRGALYRSAKAGRLEPIGIYLPSEAAAKDWELNEAATRRPDATVGLTSGWLVTT